MLENIQTEKILFLDIETVPQEANFELLDDDMKQFWDKKSTQFKTPEQTGADVYQRAGIYAEFGKIVCISVGLIFNKNGERWFRVKSFAGEDEKDLLQRFSNMIVPFSADPMHNIGGHNIKEFDVPYIARRMLINGLLLPAMIDVAGKKPWEVKFIDTLDLWKFGDYKHYTSLNLLTKIFGIPSPKDDIDGSQVASVFYNDKDIERIAVYCEKDVLATAQLVLKLKGEPLLNVENVVRAQ